MPKKPFCGLLIRYYIYYLFISNPALYTLIKRPEKLYSKALSNQALFKKSSSKNKSFHVLIFLLDFNKDKCIIYENAIHEEG